METHTDDLSPLWQAARDGDQAAFESLYRATVDSVYGLCLRMTANRALADDCTQQTFINAWRRLQGFRGGSRITTWLHRIAVNEVLGAARREKRYRGTLTEYTAEHDDALFADAPGRDAAGTDRDLEHAIAALPSRGRQVFVMHAIYGFGHAETAEMLGVAEGTCKAHYHRARQQLMNSLAPAAEATQEAPHATH